MCLYTSGHGLLHSGLSHLTELEMKDALRGGAPTCSSGSLVPIMLSKFPKKDPEGRLLIHGFSRNVAEVLRGPLGPDLNCIASL